ncbi:50S ribosomal protein L35 [bacterium]|jgi:large subunit ribosomal protein L35|nr:50S ribosomal protein L35 [bacterium]
MPKLKTNKAIKKRFKITGTGKVLRYGSGGAHLLSKKSSKRKRRAKQASSVTTKGEVKMVKNLLPYK